MSHSSQFCQLISIQFLMQDLGTVPQCYEKCDRQQIFPCAHTSIHLISIDSILKPLIFHTSFQNSTNKLHFLCDKSIFSGETPVRLIRKTTLFGARAQTHGPFFFFYLGKKERKFKCLIYFLLLLKFK